MTEVKLEKTYSSNIQIEWTYVKTEDVSESLQKRIYN